MKQNLSSSIGAISLLVFSCNATLPSPGFDDDTASEKPDCSNHDDCAPEEVCFPEGLCAKPWGSRFLLTKCSFDGPNEDDFPNCSVHCMMKDSSSGVAQWSFSPQEWDECTLVNSLQALQQGIEVRCGFVPIEDGVECPEFDSSQSLCISDGCPGFSIEHYRSEKFVELGSRSGYTLKFLLELERN